MNTPQLFARYQWLRRELETAYRAASWDSGLITRIADDLVRTEAALAVQGHPGPSRAFSKPKASAAGTAFGHQVQAANPARAMPT